MRRKKTKNSSGNKLPGRVFSDIKRHSKQRNWKFNLTKKYIHDLFQAQGQRCALTGVPLQFPQSHKKNDRTVTASLDRIDSARGYVRGNVQWVTVQVNLIKGNTPNDEFVKLCRTVSRMSKTKEKKKR